MLPQKTYLRQFYFVYPSLEILSGLLQIYLMKMSRTHFLSDDITQIAIICSRSFNLNRNWIYVTKWIRTIGWTLCAAIVVVAGTA